MVKSSFFSEGKDTDATPAQTYPTVNLVIDIQDPHPLPEKLPEGFVERKGLSEEQRQEYLKSAKETIKELADRGIPTIYISIGNSSEVYPGTRSDPDAQRDPGLLQKLGLTGIAPGPEDDVVQKRFMDTFTDIDDVRASPVLAKYIAGQRGDNNLGPDGNIEGATFGRPTFLEHLQNLGVKNVTIMGSMAEFCITDNALGAATHGISATVLSDRVIGWEDDNYRQAVWHKDAPEKHADSINAKLAEVAQDPVARGFKAEDAEKVGKAVDSIRVVTSADYLASLPAQENKLDASSPAENKGFATEDDDYGRKAQTPKTETPAAKAEAPAARKPSGHQQMKMR